MTGFLLLLLAAVAAGLEVQRRRAGEAVLPPGAGGCLPR